MAQRERKAGVNGMFSLKPLGTYLSVDSVEDGDHLDREQ